jgi:hypothetical protein
LFAIALLCLVPLAVEAGERNTYTGTVMAEFDGNNTSNILGYSIDEKGDIFDLVTYRDADTEWLKHHVGLTITVTGSPGKRGARKYLYVQKLECQPQ